MNHPNNEVKIALVAVAAIVVLFFGLQFLKGLTMLSSANTYYAHFTDVSGLSASSPVYANGYRVGVVERIDYDYSQPDNVVAEIGLDREMRLPAGTCAEITSDMLGNVKLELRLAKGAEKVMERGDTIEGATAGGLMTKAADMLPQVEAMLPKLDSILASVNALLANPDINTSLANVREMTSNLTATTLELSILSKQMHTQMPAMMDKADAVLENTEGLTRQFADMDIAHTMKSVDKAAANLEQATAALNDREGTIGMLIHDPQLYYNLNATMSSADSLLTDLRQRPKRYVHFSLFGSKSK